MICQYLSDLSIAIIGAIVGIGGAFYIFQETIQTNRKADAEKQETYLLNRMRFLINLLREVIEKTKDQISHFETQGENIKDNPYKLDFPKLLANSQLERLKSIDSQSLFEGYIFLFNDSEHTIKSYNFMLYQIDYLDKRMTQLMESNERNINSLAIDFEQMRLSVNELYARFSEFYDLLGEVKYLQIMEQFNTYIGTGEADIRSLQTEFLIPLFNEIKRMTVDIQYREKQGQLLVLIRNCTSRIGHIAVNNLNYAERDALKVRSELEDVFENLEEIKSQLVEKLDS